MKNFSLVVSLKGKTDHAHVEMGLLRRNGGMQLSKLLYLVICLHLSFTFQVSSGALEGAPKGTLQDFPHEADSRSWAVVEDGKTNHEDVLKTGGHIEQVCCNLFPS